MRCPMRSSAACSTPTTLAAARAVVGHAGGLDARGEVTELGEPVLHRLAVTIEARAIELLAGERRQNLAQPGVGQPLPVECDAANFLQPRDGPIERFALSPVILVLAASPLERGLGVGLRARKPLDRDPDGHDPESSRDGDQAHAREVCNEKTMPQPSRIARRWLWPACPALHVVVMRLRR